MPNKRLLWYKSVQAVLRKDLVCEYRAYYTAGTVCMFALITLSSISISIGGVRLTPILAAALLWVIIFFSAMAGLSRTFVHEQETGTLFSLRVYAGAQSVLFGKLVFNSFVLIGLTALIVPLFTLFFDMEVRFWSMLVGVLMLGNIGIAAVATLTAAIAAGSEGKGALFTVLTFPVVLPIFLAAIQATGTIFSCMLPELSQAIFLAGYDVTVVVAASILFDFLW